MTNTKTEASWLNKDSRTFLSRGYLREGQTAEERIREIAEAAERYLARPGFADEFEEYVLRGWISFSSPVWANYGQKRGLPISCFGSWIDDSMDEILRKNAEIGMMTKHGGGTSAYFGAIRSRGSTISDGGKTDGSVHFMEEFQTTVNLVSQSSVRRGHMAAYLPIEHGDIKEFLNIRSEDHPIQTLSFGVTVTDEWMDSMIDGDKEKKKLWTQVIKSRCETGMPYVLFIDNVNNNKPEWYKEQKYWIYASNMCVSGSTKILTDTGYKEISTFAGQNVNIWNGEQWSLSRVEQTGSDQKLLKIVTQTGQELECTPYHKFYIVENGKEVQIQASELVIGNKLAKFDLPIIEGIDGLDRAYTNGFFTGDGTNNKKHQIIYLYDEKKLLKEYIETDNNWSDIGNRMYSSTTGLKEKFFTPGANYSLQSRLDWFAGLCDSDGTVLNNNGSQQIQIASINQNFLKDVQLMLQTTGVFSTISKTKDAEQRLFPNNVEYDCKELYRLNISSYGVYTLLDNGFNPHRLILTKKKPDRYSTHFNTIVSVEEMDGLHDTFCFNEPIKHKGMFNGILTGNCTEIMLPSNANESFVCCLSSLNLLHYDEWKYSNVIWAITAFLDTVISEFIEKAKNISFLQDAGRFAERHRAIGVGVLGYHSLLQSKSIPFESEEARKLNIEIFSLLQNETKWTSEQLAQAYGEPEVLKGYGHRNSTTMAIAPTTSSSFILGQVSPSIEPINSNYFVDDLAKGVFTKKNPELKKILKEKGLDIKSVWDDILIHGGSVQHMEQLSDHEKNVFKTFGEIAQIEIITQAAVRQQYIDQGQSLNLTIHPSASPKDINMLMIEAWKLGIKSLYYQHGTNVAQEFARSLLSCQACEA